MGVSGFIVIEQNVQFFCTVTYLFAEIALGQFTAASISNNQVNYC